MIYGAHGAAEASREQNAAVRRSLDAIWSTGGDVEEYIIEELNHVPAYHYEQTLEVIEEWLEENGATGIDLDDII